MSSICGRGKASAWNLPASKKVSLLIAPQQNRDDLLRRKTTAKRETSFRVWTLILAGPVLGENVIFML
jgi:hypothetical protein